MLEYFRPRASRQPVLDHPSRAGTPRRRHLNGVRARWLAAGLVMGLFAGASAMLFLFESTPRVKRSAAEERRHAPCPGDVIVKAEGADRFIHTSEAPEEPYNELDQPGQRGRGAPGGGLKEDAGPCGERVLRWDEPVPIPAPSTSALLVAGLGAVVVAGGRK